VMARPSYKAEKPRRATGRFSHDVLKLRRAGRLDCDWIADPTPRIRKPASHGSARKAVEVIRFYREHLSGAEPAVRSSVTTQAAAYIGSTPEVMLNWRSQWRGPRYRGKNDFVRYRISDFDLWMSCRADEIRPEEVSIVGSGPTDGGIE
jgi:hypothetical protein